jgi:hypothetical protein
MTISTSLCRLVQRLEVVWLTIDGSAIDTSVPSRNLDAEGTTPISELLLSRQPSHMIEHMYSSLSKRKTLKRC